MYNWKEYNVIVHEGTKKGFKNYKQTRRKFENQWIKRKLYCDCKGCYNYLKGVEGYNGLFQTETGLCIDLRNQVFHCKKHIHKQK